MNDCFKSFMLNYGVDAKSISSYFSYVKNSYEKFMKKDLKNAPTIYERLFVLSKRSRVRYCEYMISLIKAEQQHPCSTHSKKTYGQAIFIPRFCQEFQEFSTMRGMLTTILFSVDKIVEKMWICGEKVDYFDRGIA